MNGLFILLLINCVFNFLKLHPPEVDLNLFKHFFDLYISLNLDEFDYDCHSSFDFYY